ncbi:MAG: NADH-quinone oxidoreductase subunit NuoE [Candidatus Eisenbacteria bacterium]
MPMESQDRMSERIDEIIASYEAKPTALIMILQEVQQEFYYLPREAMKQISKRMDLALSQVYGVATFYKAFSLEPRGKHHVCVCTGTACHVRNSRSIVEKLERDLHVDRGHTTKDGMFTLETVNCVGACALGPVVVADEKYWGHLTVSDVDKMLAAIREDDRAAGATGSAAPADTERPEQAGTEHATTAAEGRS